MDTKPLTVEAFTQQVETARPLVLLDVRDEEKFRAGSLQLDNVPLVHMPYATIQENGAQLTKLIASFPKDAQIVTICTSGNKAEKAASLLREQGLPAHSLQGGLTAWREKESAAREQA